MSIMNKIILALVGLVAVIALIVGSLAFTKSGGEGLLGGSSFIETFPTHFAKGLFAGAQKQVRVTENGVLLGGDITCGTSMGKNSCSIENNVGNLLIRPTITWDGIGTTTVALASISTSTAPLWNSCKKIDGTACTASLINPSRQYGYASTTHAQAPLHWRVATTTTAAAGYSVSATSTPYTNTTDTILWRKGEVLNLAVIVPVGIGGELAHNGYFQNATSSVFNRVFEAILKPLGTTTPTF